MEVPTISLLLRIPLLETPFLAAECEETVRLSKWLWRKCNLEFGNSMGSSTTPCCAGHWISGTALHETWAHELRDRDLRVTIRGARPFQHSFRETKNLCPLRCYQTVVPLTASSARNMSVGSKLRSPNEVLCDMDDSRSESDQSLKTRQQSLISPCLWTPWQWDCWVEMAHSSWLWGAWCYNRMRPHAIPGSWHIAVSLIIKIVIEIPCFDRDFRLKL